MSDSRRSAPVPSALPDPCRRHVLAAMASSLGLGLIGCGGGGGGDSPASPAPTPTPTPTPIPAPTPTPALTLPPLSPSAIPRLRGTGITPDKEWLDHATNRWKNVPSLPAAGSNVVRVFLQPFDFGDGSPLLPSRPLSERILASLAQWGELIQWSLDNRMHVVLTMALDIVYPVANVWPGDGRTLWADASAQAEFVAAWQTLARRYAGVTGVTGVIFDLINEPHGTTPAEMAGNHALPKAVWNGVHERAVDAIRQIDAGRWLIVEPIYGDPRNFVDLTPTADAKTIYSFHDYSPHSFTHQGVAGWPAAGSVNYPGIVQDTTASAPKLWDKTALIEFVAPAVAFAAKHGVRMMMGELGSTRACPPQSRLQWTTDALAVAEDKGFDIVYFQYDGWGVPADFALGWTYENSIIEPVVLATFAKNKV